MQKSSYWGLPLQIEKSTENDRRTENNAFVRQIIKDECPSGPYPIPKTSRRKSGSETFGL